MNSDYIIRMIEQFIQAMQCIFCADLLYEIALIKNFLRAYASLKALSSKYRNLDLCHI